MKNFLDNAISKFNWVWGHVHGALQSPWAFYAATIWLLTAAVVSMPIAAVLITAISGASGFIAYRRGLLVKDHIKVDEKGSNVLQAANNAYEQWLVWVGLITFALCLSNLVVISWAPALFFLIISSNSLAKIAGISTSILVKVREEQSKTEEETDTEETGGSDEISG